MENIFYSKYSLLLLSCFMRNADYYNFSFYIYINVIYSSLRLIYRSVICGTVLNYIMSVIESWRTWSRVALHTNVTSFANVPHSLENLFGLLSNHTFLFYHSNVFPIFMKLREKYSCSKWSIFRFRSHRYSHDKHINEAFFANLSLLRKF